MGALNDAGETKSGGALYVFQTVNLTLKDCIQVRNSFLEKRTIRLDIL